MLCRNVYKGSNPFLCATKKDTFLGVFFCGKRKVRRKGCIRKGSREEREAKKGRKSDKVCERRHFVAWQQNISLRHKKGHLCGVFFCGKKDTIKLLIHNKIIAHYTSRKVKRSALCLSKNVRIYNVSTLIKFEFPLLPFGVPPVITMVSPFFTKPLFLAISLAK